MPLIQTLEHISFYDGFNSTTSRLNSPTRLNKDVDYMYLLKKHAGRQYLLASDT